MGWYWYVASTGTVFVGISRVWENPTHSIPMFNPNYFKYCLLFKHCLNANRNFTMASLPPLTSHTCCFSFPSLINTLGIKLWGSEPLTLAHSLSPCHHHLTYLTPYISHTPLLPINSLDNGLYVLLSIKCVIFFWIRKDTYMQFPNWTTHAAAHWLWLHNWPWQ